MAIDKAAADSFIFAVSKVIDENMETFSFLQTLPNPSSSSTCTTKYHSLTLEKGPATAIGLNFSHTSQLVPSSWIPKFILPNDQGSVLMNTLEIFPLKPSPITFILEPCYRIDKVLPRSFFAILYQCNITHTFVFNLHEPECPFFHEIAGLRQSTFVPIIEKNTDEKWELHLKPSKGLIFGYLCRPADIYNVIKDQMESLIRSKKLPLVLDLDDTLVRMVGENNPERFVPGEKIASISHRVRELKDGRKVVLAEKVHEFLDWASKLFDISVCSLGDQQYVDMVCQILNSEAPIIRSGVAYSARGEYLFLSQNSQQTQIRKPPKDLNSLYAFYDIRDQNTPRIEPIILDDNATMWPLDQQDNIIIVREMAKSPVWNVSLFPVVQQVLSYIHEGYFRKMDGWLAADPAIRGAAPSSLTYYKEYLRRELSNNIAGS